MTIVFENLGYNDSKKKGIIQVSVYEYDIKFSINQDGFNSLSNTDKIAIIDYKLWGCCPGFKNLVCYPDFKGTVIRELNEITSSDRIKKTYINRHILPDDTIIAVKQSSLYDSDNNAIFLIETVKYIYCMQSINKEDSFTINKDYFARLHFIHDKCEVIKPFLVSRRIYSNENANILVDEITRMIYNR